MKTLLCPVCFMREIDVVLAYDEDEGEYYCQRCCYEGKAEEVENGYKQYTRYKYKEMAKPYNPDQPVKGL